MLPILLTALFVPTSSMAATPADIEIFHAAQTRADHGGNPDEATSREITALLRIETLKRVDRIAKSREYPTWFHSRNPLILAAVTELIETDQKQLGTNAQGLYTLTTRTLAGVYAEAAMAKAAGMPTPQRPQESQEPPLHSRATVSSSRGPLTLRTDRSTVQKDEGLSGSGNGVLDPGESATISLVFENSGSNRLYSSSIYVQGTSDCLYTLIQPEREFELPEMDAGAATRLEVPVYASSECTESTASLTLHAYDSRAFSARPLVFEVNFELASPGSSQLASLTLDGDDYGYSEVADFQPLQPEDRVEMSTGFKVQGSTPLEVIQSFTVPSPLQAKHTPATTSFLVRDGQSHAKAVDDLDIRVPKANELRSGLDPWMRHMDWKTPLDARLFIAVDSRITEQNETEASSSVIRTVFDQSKVEAALLEHVTVEPVTSRGAGPGLTLVRVDGFTVSVEDPNALMAALEATARQVEGEGDSGRNVSVEYVVRHYIEVPIFWEPQPVTPSCELGDLQASYMQGVDMKILGWVRDLPEGALVELYVGGSQFDIDASRGDFQITIRFPKAGVFNILLRVVHDDSRICHVKKQVTIRAPPTVDVPEAPPEAPPEPLVNRYPRMIRIEPGLLGLDGLGGQLGISAGNQFRFVARGSYVLNDIGLGVGIRATGAIPYESNEDVVFEASVQFLGGWDAYLGGFTEIAATVASHGTVGPYLTVGRLFSGLGGDTTFAGGLGFYFPPKKG